MGEHLVEIKEQTIKTNGRVTSLESSRSWLWGAIAVFAILGSVIITLSLIAIDSKIKDGIADALLQYEPLIDVELR